MASQLLGCPREGKDGMTLCLASHRHPLRFLSDSSQGRWVSLLVWASPPSLPKEGTDGSPREGPGLIQGREQFYPSYLLSQMFGASA